MPEQLAPRPTPPPVRAYAAIVAIAIAIAIVAPTAGAGERWGPWSTIDAAAGLPSNKVFAVLAVEDGVWAGTDHGLAWIERGEVKRRLTADDGLPYPVVTALAASPRTGDLWVGTMGGLARVSAGRIEAFTQLDSGLANDVIYGVAVDGDTVWVATAAGLSALHTSENRWDLYDVSNTLMHEPWCYAVTTSPESDLVAVWGGGVIERDRKTGRFREHRDPDGEMEIDLFRNDGLVHDVTSSVAYGDGVLWVGTYFGLSRYEGRRWQSFSQSDSGLAGDFINSVRADGRAVWIATDRGLSRFDGDDWQSWDRAADGLPSDVIYGVDLDAARGLWLATAAGLGHAPRRLDTATAATPPSRRRAALDEVRR